MYDPIHADHTYFLFLLLLSNEVLFAYDATKIKEKLTPGKGEYFSSTVIEIIDGDTVLLANNMEVRLVGLQAPKIALGRKDFKEWPLGYEAKDVLSKLIIGKEVTLFYGGRELDRYGRTLAHLFTNDNIWVQGEMLKNGMARVYSFADNRSIVEEMLEEEYQARLQNRGIWGLEFYKIKPQEESGKYTNSFQVISGRIRDVAEVRNNTYLNFGDDYRNDFTIVIPNRVKKMFQERDINLTNFKDKNIFVRGWLKYYNGPSIDLSHPEQLAIQ
ncbi:MAG: thermonuclease family protein [Emcibacteraceae bacterium]|nr:thermonuclease family protein [Emcibacteraceae bacterium]MDG1726782.1 thermonuclease family protein [Emcibacteraceae bacterium]